MKIAVVAPVAPIKGGIAQHATRLVEEFRRQGNDVLVASWRSQYPRALYPGVEDRRAAKGAIEPLLTWWNPTTWFKAALKLRHRQLLVITWVTPFHLLAQVVTLCVARPRRTVLIVHNFQPHESFPGSRFALKALLGLTDHVVTHSEHVARGVRELRDCVSVSIVEHPPNLDLTSSPLPQYPPVGLLCFGYVRRYKGIDLAIEALADLVGSGNDVHLTVVGEFWEPVGYYEQLSARLGVADRVNIVDAYVPDAEVGQYFSSHHIVLVPYRRASQSGITALAKAAARPIVATGVGGLAEFVRPGEGLVAEDLTPRALANAVSQCIDSLGRRGLHQRHLPSWEALVGAIVEMAMPIE